ncbi:MAG: hypothetical protein LBV38_03660 [Alistipes sp.]|nr:hypothetical protein [Alistipes sp.]
MIEITTDHYRALAQRLRREIGPADWFNGRIEMELPSPEASPEASPAEKTIAATLILTAIIYRRPETLPEGPARPITDVVPVWWEFHTSAPEQTEQTPNDFTFSELKPHLIDYD